MDEVSSERISNRREEIDEGKTTCKCARQCKKREKKVGPINQAAETARLKKRGSEMFGGY